MIRVLIVDDEYIMRQGLKYMIDWEKEGYEIVGEASNGKAALDLIDKLRPQIVISDIVMPMLDGVDFSDVIHRLYPSIQMIILSGYDKFEYVKKTFQNGVADYILKPTLNQEELIGVLERASAKLPSYQTDSVKKGSTASPRTLLERYLIGLDDELHIRELSELPSHTYLAFYAANIKKENRVGDSLTDILYHTVERYLSDDKIYNSIICILREEILCTLITYERADEEKLIGDLSELTDRLKVICEDIFAVALTSIHTSDIKSLQTIYNSDIAPSVDKSFYYEDTPFLMLKRGMNISDNEPDMFDYFRYNQLLWGSRYVEAAEMLSKYNKKALDNRLDSYRLKNQVENMVYHYLDSLNISDDDRDTCRKRYFSSIKEARYKRAYEKAVSDIIDELLAMSKEEYLKDDDRIAKILDYIVDNYQEDLKLEDLAEEFNFNYHYLSTYFNRHINEGFSDYLNRVRIEKACKLLLESDISIAGVSSEVGYSEHSYFCRVFKKMVGDTPSAWRRKQHGA